MSRYLFVGDTHGDLEFAERAISYARDNHARVIQVGDWGFKWPGADRVSELAALLVRYGVVMRFIDGNHDDHAWLAGLQANHPAPTVQVAPGLYYQPRGSTLRDDDGTCFLFCGGAPSIDAAERVESVSWWPEETISEDDYHRAMKAVFTRHVLVTHDAPAMPPDFTQRGSVQFQARSARSMEMVAALAKRHRPLLHVHGHWHDRYTRGATEGLDCNTGAFENAVLLWERP